MSTYSTSDLEDFMRESKRDRDLIIKIRYLSLLFCRKSIRIERRNEDE